MEPDKTSSGEEATQVRRCFVSACRRLLADWDGHLFCPLCRSCSIPGNVCNICVNWTPEMRQKALDWVKPKIKEEPKDPGYKLPMVIDDDGDDDDIILIESTTVDTSWIKKESQEFSKPKVVSDPNDPEVIIILSDDEDSDHEDETKAASSSSKPEDKEKEAIAASSINSEKQISAGTEEAGPICDLGNPEIRNKTQASKTSVEGSKRVTDQNHGGENSKEQHASLSVSSSPDEIVATAPKTAVQAPTESQVGLEAGLQPKKTPEQPHETPVGVVTMSRANEQHNKTALELSVPNHLDSSTKVPEVIAQQVSLDEAVPITTKDPQNSSISSVPINQKVLQVETRVVPEEMEPVPGPGSRPIIDHEKQVFKCAEDTPVAAAATNTKDRDVEATPAVEVDPMAEFPEDKQTLDSNDANDPDVVTPADVIPLEIDPENEESFHVAESEIGKEAGEDKLGDTEENEPPFNEDYDSDGWEVRMKDMNFKDVPYLFVRNLAVQAECPTFAPATIAPAVNPNVERNPNPNPNP